MWYVYILECTKGTLYTGITKDLKRRFEEHKKKKARYTSYNPPKRIVYKEIFPTRSRASKRESEIKAWPRRKKLSLINGIL